MADEGAARPDPSVWSRGGAGAPDDAAAERTAADPLGGSAVEPAPDGAAAGTDGAATLGGQVCSWCSVELGISNPDRCPNCGAALREDPETSVPGVTAVDPEAVRRAATWERVRKRATLRGFLEADRDESADSGIRPSSLAALGPPSAELRQEMDRLREELEAAAEREALELEALAAEEEAAARRAETPPAQTVAEDGAT